LLLEQVGWLGAFLALLGIVITWANAPRLLLLTLWMAVTSIVFAADYNTFDWFVNLLSAVLAMTIWLGLGIAASLDRIAGRAPKAAAAVAASLFLIGIVQVADHLPQADASQDHRAEEFARRVLNDAPPAAMTFTNGDEDTFPLWYFHFALNERPDVIIVVKGLLAFDWYRRSLQARDSGVVIPNELKGDWKNFMREQNARPVCETLPRSANALSC